MKHVGHLIAADLRRYPLLLASSVLVTIVSTVVDGIAPSLSLDPSTRAAVGLLGTLFGVASAILTIMAIALIVQIYPLVGSDAFWMTRPIPALALLAEKLLVLSFVVVLVPALADVGLMWAFGVPWKTMAQVFVQGLPYSIFLLVLLMSAAAITRSLPRYMLLLAGGVGCLALALGVLIAVITARLEEESTGMAMVSSSPADPTSSMVMLVLLAVAGLALLQAQYTSRSRLRAVGIGVAGLCAAVLIGVYWPWPLLRPIDAAPFWATRPQSAQLTGIPGSLRSETMHFSFRTTQSSRTLSAAVTIAGLEPGWSAVIAPSRSSLDVNGHVVWTIAPGMYGSLRTATAQTGTEHAAFQSVLGVGRLLETSPAPTRTILITMRDAEFQRLGAQHATFRTQAQVNLTRNYVEAVMPLLPGSRFHEGAHDVLVLAAQRNSTQMRVVVRDSEPHSMFERAQWSSTQYFLRSRAASEAVYGSAEPLEMIVGPLRVFGLSAGGSNLAFPPKTWSIRFDRADRVTQPPTWQLDDRWVDAAELVIVRSVPQGSVTRALEMADLDVKNAPPSER